LFLVAVGAKQAFAIRAVHASIVVEVSEKWMTVVCSPESGLSIVEPMSRGRRRPPFVGLWRRSDQDRTAETSEKPQAPKVRMISRPITEHVVQSVSDQLGRQTAYAYDSMSNVMSITRLAGTFNAVTTSFTYDATFNQLTSTTDPINHAWTLGRDSSLFF